MNAKRTLVLTEHFLTLKGFIYLFVYLFIYLFALYLLLTIINNLLQKVFFSKKRLAFIIVFCKAN